MSPRTSIPLGEISSGTGPGCGSGWESGVDGEAPMHRSITGSLIAVSLALTACADQQGWLKEGPPTVYGGGYEQGPPTVYGGGYGPGYGYDYAPYPPAGGFIVGGFGSEDYDRWYRRGQWRREHPNWGPADAQRYWHLQQQKAQNEAIYRQRALQWEQQQKQQQAAAQRQQLQNQAVLQQRALQWEQQQKQQQAAAQWQQMQNQAVLQQRALQWEQQNKQQQAMRQWGLMQQEWKRLHPGQ